MKQIRQLHLYLGTFFAPSIIFFAITGAFQTYNFHEEYQGRPATPLFEKLAKIHKDQRVPAPTKPPVPKPEAARPSAIEPPPQGSPLVAASQDQVEKSAAQSPDKPVVQQDEKKEAAPQRLSGAPRAPRRKRSELLKLFVGLMAISLVSTSLLGIYMSFKYNRDQRVVWGLLILGTVLPIVLLYL
jgi:hypothetical protein